MHETITFNEVEYKIEDMTEEQKGALFMANMSLNQVKIAQIACDALTNKLGELLEDESSDSTEDDSDTSKDSKDS